MAVSTSPRHRDPSFSTLRGVLGRALYDPDPLERALASAQLTDWGLPAEPRALIMAAERRRLAREFDRLISD